MADGGTSLSAEIRKALQLGDEARARQLMLDPRAIAGAQAALEQDAKAARNDVCKFFEFVMREETTKARLKSQPHQEIFFRFVMDHIRSVGMLPVGHSKTMCAAALTLKFLGDDPTTRGVFVSGAQEQAAKPLAMVADYIGDGTDEKPGSPELKLVYPRLRKARRGKWTETSITIERPMGIRDPSVRAVGYGGNIQGSRLSWIVVDDLLNAENTATKESLEKVYNWFFNSVLNRLDPKTGKIIVINTAWHPDDLVHRLEKKGWATLRMAIDGTLKVQDDVRNVESDVPPWDHPELVPRNDDPTDDTLVLRSNPPGVLFPARHTLESIAELREDFLPKVFNQMFMNLCRDDDTAFCKREWVETCLENARRMGVTGFSPKRRANGACFTGVDLAVSPGEESDDCSFFTFEVLPSGHRVVLDVEVGKFDGPTIVQKCIEKHRWYDSIVCVENNACQDFILQFTRAQDISVPLKPHTTGRNKAHAEHGVHSIFLEMKNGAWLLPNDKHGRMPKAIERFVQDCLYFAPSKHTGDVLMSAWFARDQARKWGALGNRPSGANVQQGSFATNLMAR